MLPDCDTHYYVFTRCILEAGVSQVQVHVVHVFTHENFWAFHFPPF